MFDVTRTHYVPDGDSWRRQHRCRGEFSHDGHNGNSAPPTPRSAALALTSSRARKGFETLTNTRLSWSMPATRPALGDERAYQVSGVLAGFPFSHAQRLLLQ